MANIKIYTLKGAAKALGLSENTLKQRVSRLRKSEKPVIVESIEFFIIRGKVYIGVNNGDKLEIID